jgi:DNA polymerase III subunit gamma/tau
MSQALYRKYRSRAMDEVVGQEHITDTLARAIKAGHISHAYLFTGPRGTGKTSVARILAHAINGLPYSDSANLDIVEIDAASNRRIDDIRDLREKVHIAPIAAKYKVYIIDEVHMLTGESFNALLKTLEEPPSHVVFILATTEAHKLPATIISRTQRFAFRAADPKKNQALLKEIATKEKLKISDEALALITEHGNGSFRDSESLLDQMAHVTNGTIESEDVQRTLGLAPKAALNNMANALLNGDHAAVSQALKNFEDQGSSPGALVQQITQVLSERGRENPELFGLIDQLLEVPRAYNPSLKLLSTLMLFATKQSKPADGKPVKSAAIMAATVPSLSITAEKPVVKPKAVKLESKTEVLEEPDEELPASGAPTKLSELTNKDWNKLLAAIKKSDAPLFSVIKQAVPNFDATTNTLSLAFKYQLHRKKMDTIKLKNSTISFMRSVLGGIAAITTELDPKAKPPILSDDPAVTSVAAIMGGGDVVDAEKI